MAKEPQYREVSIRKGAFEEMASNIESITVSVEQALSGMADLGWNLDYGNKDNNMSEVINSSFDKIQIEVSKLKGELLSSYEDRYSV